VVDLLRRLIVRHPVAVDTIVAMGLGLIGEAAVATARPGALHAVSTAIAVVPVAAAVAVRRPWPVAAAGLVFAAVIVDRVTGGNLSRTGIGWAAVVLVGYSAGAHASRREGPIALGLLLASMTIVYVSVAHQKGTAPSEWLWELAFAAAPYGVGRLLRARRRLHAELEDRALALTHEREQRQRLAVGVERARIARELHDVAAHSLSVMVVQAGAARSVLDATPDAAAGALDAIATTGRQTMADLRRLLGFLETDDASSLGGVSRIGDLVAQARLAGLPVEVQDHGHCTPSAERRGSRYLPGGPGGPHQCAQARRGCPNSGARGIRGCGRARRGPRRRASAHPPSAQRERGWPRTSRYARAGRDGRW
jgi:signal transduction histidine kinase